MILGRRISIPKVARMISTLVGESGREYVPVKLLQEHPVNSTFDIHLASCDNQGFVLKPVTQSIFSLMQKLKEEFKDSQRLRHYTDHNTQQTTLVYEYFKSDLLSLVQNYPPLPLWARKRILKEVGEGLNEMHAQNWLHLDLKPNNVFVNGHVDDKDEFHLEKVTLGDLDCALKLVRDIPLDATIGNVMWRSPEGQMGIKVGKYSEVFSFGLLCLYVLTGTECFHPDFEKLKEEGMPPELPILYSLLAAFGPVPDALVQFVDDEGIGQYLKDVQAVITEDETNKYFEEWTDETFPNLTDEAKRLIRRMTYLDPAKRATMSEVLEDDYWQEN